MKSFAVLAALAAFATFSAAHVTMSNGTHFIDPMTNQTIRHFNCDVHRGKASHHFNKTIDALYKGHKHSKAGPRAARSHGHKKKQVGSPIQVATYFHVISGTADASTITQQMANNQMTELNTAYKPYGISFTLVNTSFTTNDAWSVAAGSDMEAAKAALRAGTYSNLNLYFHTDLSGGMLGTCTLPSQVAPGSPASVYVSDGCNINANTMPGGTMTGYNLGKTAVHETGHWLGLLHTFEGYSCTGDGDSIADTRVEAQSTNGCPNTPAKNTCPTVPGVDPISNYMDYSTDACYEQFTADQVARMDSMWTQYRAGM